MTIGSAATGTVKEVLVQEWSHVHAGELLVSLDCQPLAAEVEARAAGLSAATAVFDRVRNGPRPAEITVGEAAVGYSKARADEAQKALDRTLALHEGVSVTTARILEVQRDARISAALLAEAEAKLALLREGSRRASADFPAHGGATRGCRDRARRRLRNPAASRRLSQEYRD